MYWVRRAKMVQGFVPHVLAGHMTWNAFFDLLQHRHFEDQRAGIEFAHRGKVVGFANGQMFVGGTVHEVFDAAHAAHGKRQIYFEPIGFELFPGGH